MITVNYIVIVTSKKVYYLYIILFQDQVLLSENYCDRSEAFKALAYYKPYGCKPYTTPEPQQNSVEIKPTASEVFTHESIAHVTYDATVSFVNQPRCTVLLSAIIFLRNFVL